MTRYRVTLRYHSDGPSTYVCRDHWRRRAGTLAFVDHAVKYRSGHIAWRSHDEGGIMTGPLPSPAEGLRLFIAEAERL